MSTTLVGLLALGIPAIAIGVVVLWRSRAVLLMYLAAMAVGLGYLNVTGAVDDIGAQVLSTMPQAAAPVVPVAAPAAAPVEAPKQEAAPSSAAPVEAPAAKIEAAPTSTPDPVALPAAPVEAAPAAPEAAAPVAPTEAAK